MKKANMLVWHSEQVNVILGWSEELESVFDDGHVDCDMLSIGEPPDWGLWLAEVDYHNDSTPEDVEIIQAVNYRRPTEGELNRLSVGQDVVEV